jgi:hypothetical protein
MQHTTKRLRVAYWPGQHMRPIPGMSLENKPGRALGVDEDVYVIQEATVTVEADWVVGGRLVVKMALVAAGEGDQRVEGWITVYPDTWV